MTWLISWGVSCSQGGCKENQDGWFATCFKYTSENQQNIDGDDVNNAEQDTSKDLNSFEKLRLSNLNTYSHGVWTYEPLDGLKLNKNNQPSRTDDLSSYHNDYIQFPSIFDVFPIQPLQPKRISPAWIHHTCGEHSSLINSSTPCFFGLFDGHGYYGKTASHIAAYSLNKELIEKKSNFMDNNIDSTIDSIRNVLENAYFNAHNSIIDTNIAVGKDFGTTGIVIGIIESHIVTANCGDSLGICIIPDLYPNKPEKQNSNSSHYTFHSLPILPKSSASIDVNNHHVNTHYHSINYLCNPHCLYRKSERERVDQSGYGKVIFGNYGMLRLIPSHLTYQEAKNLGLSISMSRSLGHMHLSRCALLHNPDFTTIDISQFPPKEIKKNRSHTNLENNNVSKIQYQHINQDKDLYVVLISDGVSDVMDVYSITDILNKNSKLSMKDIALTITMEAEKRRRLNHIRADNCTAIVIKLKRVNHENTYDQIIEENKYNESIHNNTHLNHSCYSSISVESSPLISKLTRSSTKQSESPSNFILRRNFTPLSRRRQYNTTTPSPARTKPCKLRDLPSINSYI